jgi:hypothetical protein
VHRLNVPLHRGRFVLWPVYFWRQLLEIALEPGPQHGHRDAIRRPLRQHRSHDRLQLLPIGRVVLPQGRRRGLCNHLAQFLNRAVVRQRIGGLAGQQFVEDEPEGIHITLGGDGAKRVGHLLGTHIGRRPGGRNIDAREQCIISARQAKIDHHGTPLRVHQQIGRFQVTVDDPVLMRVPHRVTHAEHQGEALWPGQGVLLSVGGNRHPPTHEFHG